MKKRVTVIIHTKNIFGIPKRRLIDFGNLEISQSKSTYASKDGQIIWIKKARKEPKYLRTTRAK